MGLGCLTDGLKELIQDISGEDEVTVVDTPQVFVGVTNRE